MATGLGKQKKYNWKETNLSLFGSDLEKKVFRCRDILWQNTACALDQRLMSDHPPSPSDQGGQCSRRGGMEGSGDLRRSPSMEDCEV